MHEHHALLHDHLPAAKAPVLHSDGVRSGRYGIAEKSHRMARRERLATVFDEHGSSGPHERPSIVACTCIASFATVPTWAKNATITQSVAPCVMFAAISGMVTKDVDMVESNVV